MSSCRNSRSIGNVFTLQHLGSDVQPMDGVPHQSDAVARFYDHNLAAKH